MALMKMTPNGTLYAATGGVYVDGICMGIYGKGNCISLEYDSKENRLNLLLMDEKLDECDIHIKHVDSEWEEIR